jgi:hypothetical protein
MLLALMLAPANCTLLSALIETRSPSSYSQLRKRDNLRLAEWYAPLSDASSMHFSTESSAPALDRQRQHGEQFDPHNALSS